MENTPLLRTLVAALVLAATHVFAGRLRFLEGIPRSRWLSGAGGVSVAYVFLHLLPELSEGQAVAEETFEEAGLFLQHHVYLLALVGLALFYGLERYAKTRQPRDEAPPGETDAVFWTHVGSFAVYNLLIGYLLLHREGGEGRGLLLFAVAMLLHFVVNDFGLREHHEHLYARVGRWALAAAVLAGWGLGALTEVPEVVVACIMAFVGGGVILNVLKEELPEERQSRFGAFLLGATIYAAILLFL